MCVSLCECVCVYVSLSMYNPMGVFTYIFIYIYILDDLWHNKTDNPNNPLSLSLSLSLSLLGDVFMGMLNVENVGNLSFKNLENGKNSDLDSRKFDKKTIFDPALFFQRGATEDEINLSEELEEDERRAAVEKKDRAQRQYLLSCHKTTLSYVYDVPTALQYDLQAHKNPKYEPLKEEPVTTVTIKFLTSAEITYGPRMDNQRGLIMSNFLPPEFRNQVPCDEPDLVARYMYIKLYFENQHNVIKVPHRAWKDLEVKAYKDKLDSTTDNIDTHDMTIRFALSLSLSLSLMTDNMNTNTYVSMTCWFRFEQESSLLITMMQLARPQVDDGIYTYTYIYIYP